MRANAAESVPRPLQRAASASAPSALSLALVALHLDLPVADAHVVAWDTARRRTGEHSTALDAEARAVPWTLYGVFLQRALMQWPTVVRASGSDTVDPLAQADQQDRRTRGRHDPVHRIVGDLGERRHPLVLLDIGFEVGVIDAGRDAQDE